MNHYRMTCRETGGRDAVGLQQWRTTHKVIVVSDSYFGFVIFVFVVFNHTLSISVFPQPFIVLILSASFGGQEGISRLCFNLFVYFASWNLIL